MYPNLKTFVTTTVLPALVMRKAWTNRMLWQGFLIVCQVRLVRFQDIRVTMSRCHCMYLLYLCSHFAFRKLHRSMGAVTMLTSSASSDQYPVRGQLAQPRFKAQRVRHKATATAGAQDKAKATATPQTPQSATPAAAVTATAAAAAGDPVAPPPVTAPTVILQQQPKSRPAPPPPPPAQQPPVEPAGGEVEMQDGERTPEGPRTPETPE